MALALNLELPWSSSIDDDKRYNKILLVCIVVLLVASVLVTIIKVPDLARAEKEKLPPQLARVVLEKQELPPPKPIELPKPEEKKPDEKKPEPVVEKPVELKPEPKPVEQPKQPSRTPPKESVERAREQAENQVNQFKDDLAEMRDMMQTSVVETAATTVTNSTGEAAQVDRAMITSGAKVASGGINTAAMSRDTGGVALSGRETTKVKSGLAEVGKKAGSAQKGNSDAGGGAARSREEIGKIMDQHKGAIYSIYNRALRQNPALQGKMVMELVIDPSGRILEVRLLSSELSDSALESRIMQRIKLIVFPAAKVERLTFKQSFDFLPQ